METVKKSVQNERHEATAKYVARSDDVSALGLTTRSANCLHRAGIHAVGALINFPAEKLISINNIGVKSLEEIKNVLQRIKSDDNGYLVLTESADSIVNDSRCTLPSNQLLKDAAQQLAVFFGEGDDVWFRELSYIINVTSDLSMGIVTDKIYSSECFRAKIKQMVLEHIDLNNNQSCLSVLQNTLPQCLSNTELFHELLQEMESEELIAFDNEFVCRKYPGLLECINQIENEADRNLLIARLNGKTLDEIGREFNLSQQRVRIKIKRLLHKIPTVEEDKYRYIIKNYDISLEDFQLAFEVPKTTYYYLYETYYPEHKKRDGNDAGIKDIRDILNDENIPYKMRKQAEKIVLKNFVLVNGRYVKKRKTVLIKHFIKTFCFEETKLDDFVRLYHNWLAELGVFGDDKLSLDHHGVKNFLFKSEFVLCSLGNTFRYYDIAAYDFSELLEVLNLNSYVNLEISTLKLFRDYKELMIRFDIRNEYELHNLLKKIMPQDNGNIKFGRTPNIEIGTVDRKKQLCTFLLSHSPITVEDAANKYEETFGVKGATLIADYLPLVGGYLHNGVYCLSPDSLLNPKNYD